MSIATITGVGQLSLVMASVLLIISLYRDWPLDRDARAGTVLFIALYFGRLGLGTLLRDADATDTLVYRFVAHNWTIALNTWIIAAWMFAAFLPAIPYAIRIRHRD